MTALAPAEGAGGDICPLMWQGVVLTLWCGGATLFWWGALSPRRGMAGG